MKVRISPDYLHEVSEYNARLVLASRQLLAALRACHIQMLYTNNGSKDSQRAHELAVMAIAKAEGLNE